MAIKKGLASLQGYNKELLDAAAERNRPKADWFKWDNKTEVYMNFLQELDPDSDNYDEAQGLGVVAIEHFSVQEDFRKKRHALCTAESQGACWACDQHRNDRKAGWGPKSSLYITVAYAFSEDEKPKRGVLTRNFNSSFGQDVLAEAVDENTIVGRTYKVRKSGAGTTTAWSLKPSKTFQMDTSGLEAYDLENTVLREIAVDQQPAFYGYAQDGGEIGVSVAPTESTQEKPPAANDEW